MANRLAHETSPYLLQHANNPVDWYPWGPEALDRSASEDKPILLSIGYSACHWCHVMEHESFENEAIAKSMNGNFINIKVDREERPDLDHIYMAAVQAMTGSGGWPLTVFLLPNGQPFFGGTYFPPEDRYERPGFLRILETIAEAYRTRRQDVAGNAKTLLEHLNRQTQKHPEAASVDSGILDDAYRTLASRFDARNGGFGGAPKFPPGMVIDFLLRHHHRTHIEQALEMACLTLDKMACGGIYDHAGGGFHRYSTDDRWLVPHFEKMLYDNALLSGVYLDAFRATGKRLYKRIVEETLDFVVREMRHPEGGFYSTQDADSEGVEGKFYVWDLEEFTQAAGPDVELLAKYFDVTERGNFEGKNILNISRSPELFCKLENLTPEELESKAGDTRQKLYDIRQKRARPGRDEKILTDWNGMMLRSFAAAAAQLGRDDYRIVAETNADFLLNTLWDGTRLFHNFKDGRARFNGCLGDYANLADGLFALYQLTLDRKWLDRTLAIADRMIAAFWDSEAGGFYFTSQDHENLISRTKDYFDGATPSGNSVAANILLRLAALLDRADYRQKAEQVIRNTSPLLAQHAPGFGRMLAAVDFYAGPSMEIVFAGSPERFIPVLRRHYLPRTVIGADMPNRPTIGGKPAAYVCENSACKAPATDPVELERLIVSE